MWWLREIQWNNLTCLSGPEDSISLRGLCFVNYNFSFTNKICFASQSFNNIYWSIFCLEQHVRVLASFHGLPSKNDLHDMGTPSRHVTSSANEIKTCKFLFTHPYFVWHLSPFIQSRATWRSNPIQSHLAFQLSSDNALGLINCLSFLCFQALVSIHHWARLRPRNWWWSIGLGLGLMSTRVIFN